MVITITLRGIEDGQVEIEETRLPYSGEKADSVTTASALADELRKCADDLGISRLRPVVSQLVMINLVNGKKFNVL